MVCCNDYCFQRVGIIVFTGNDEILFSSKSEIPPEGIYLLYARKTFRLITYKWVLLYKSVPKPLCSYTQETLIKKLQNFLFVLRKRSRREKRGAYNAIS